MSNLQFCLVLIFFTLTVSFCQCTTCVNETCWSCGNSRDPLDLKCHRNQIVTAIIRAGFRDKYADDTSCTYKPESDCFDETSNYRLISQILQCVWTKNFCRFNQAAGRPRTGTCSLNMRARYLVATDFACVNATDIHTMCITNTQVLLSTEDTFRYILSPGLQSPYVHKQPDYNQSLCAVNIKTDPGLGINIWSTYIDIHIDDYIAVSINNDDVRNKQFLDLKFTGNKAFKVFIPHDDIKVMFVINSYTHGHIGFAVKYSSYVIPLRNDSAVYFTSDTVISTDTHLVKQTTPTITTMQPSKTEPTINSRHILIIVTVFVVVFTILVLAALVLFARQTYLSSRDSAPATVSGVNLDENNRLNEDAIGAAEEGSVHVQNNVEDNGRVEGNGLNNSVHPSSKRALPKEEDIESIGMELV